MQQLFPFHSIYHPEHFHGDLITEAMRGYLAPAHYLLGWLITLFCKDPVMTGHVMMLIQLAGTALFVFLTVSRLAGAAAAFFSVAFLLHTDYLLERMTAGLPRGWAPVIFSALIYLICKGNHPTILLLLLVSILLNPPAAFLAAFCYGVYLCTGFVFAWIRSSRTTTSSQVSDQSRGVIANYRRGLAVFITLTPLYIALAVHVTAQPAALGHLITYQEATTLPEFSRPKGRFAFIPFAPISQEITDYFLNTFQHSSDRSRKDEDNSHFTGFTLIQQNLLPITLCLFGVIVTVGTVRRQHPIPFQLWCLPVSSLLVYLLARHLAFHLYVPDRHINVSLPIFTIVALSVGSWRAFYGRQLLPRKIAHLLGEKLVAELPSALALGLLGLLIYGSSGSGLSGQAKFNVHVGHRSSWLTWVRTHTPPTATIAGFPSHMDPVPLFAIRRAYVTAETWHPFYSEYNREMKRRIEITLQAYFSKSLSEIVKLLRPEGVDYIVFRSRHFSNANQTQAQLYAPFSETIRRLTTLGDPAPYAFELLPDTANLESAPYLVYRDHQVAIVDLKVLEKLAHQTFERVVE